MEQQQKEERLSEPIGVFERLFTENPTARILDYFLLHRFRSYTVDQVAKALGLSSEAVAEGINLLEKREIVRPSKKIENANNIFNNIAYTLYVESMTANAIIRAAFEIENAARILSVKQNRESKEG